ncbi:hypothetical protein P879_04961 [Paragonimus westermani]|uniref:RING-type domain-containing protein n=1 Tax=Paragonimus westermani TaxID=34504 RepID=A0A8T0D2X3_9TREM|nr:hypothetical protein P879_04961 [Paragonimus westermani]
MESGGMADGVQSGLRHTDVNRSMAPFVNILRPRYRAVFRHCHRRPCLLRFCGNLSVLTCFAITLCATTYMFELVDDIFDEPIGENKSADLSGSQSQLKTRLSVATLRSVLEQRGIATDLILERNELDMYLEATGEITREELACAAKVNAEFKEFQASKSPDAILHQKVLSSQRDPLPDSALAEARSILFDSESAFVERVDDNKDSVWLLAVVVASAFSKQTTSSSSEVHGASIITSEIWGHLVHQFGPFGFKLGLIDCHRLQSVCHDRGFIAADLVLALPKGGDRIKDSVQFRPYPRQKISSRSSVASYSTGHALQLIRAWLSSVLSERVRQVNTVEHILPASSQLIDFQVQSNWFAWLRQRPQPLHVFWLPQTLNKSMLTSSTMDYASPPMVLSALSVPYTGRVRFWTVVRPLSDTQLDRSDKLDSHWPVTQRSIDSVSNLLLSLGCQKNAIFLILTPESKCYTFGKQEGEYLSYANLELYLRFLYPSVDDFVLISAVLINLLVLINTAIGAGNLFAHLLRYATGILNPLPNPVSGLRSGVAQIVVRLARRGWTSHNPSRRLSVTDPDTYLDPSAIATSTIQRKIVRKHFISFGKTLLLDSLSINILFLLSILPLINGLSLPRASFIINPFLYLLRSFVNIPQVVAFRLSVLNGHMNWRRFLLVAGFFWLLLTSLMTHVYFVLRSTHQSVRQSRGRNRFTPSMLLRRLSTGSPEQVLSEVTRLLLSASDLESRAELTSSSASSTTDGDAAPAFDVPAALNDSNPPPTQSSRSLTDSNILLTQLNRLYRLLHNEHQIPSSPTAVEGVDEQDYGRRSRAASAHIYTWQCSNIVARSEKSNEHAQDRVSNSSLTRDRKSGRRNETQEVFQHLSDSTASHVSSTEADYEAEDEEDELLNTPVDRSNPTRRFRPRRPRLPLRFNTDSSSSSPEYSESDADEPLNPADSVSRPNTFANWPSWVIPCDTCVVCWRSFRPRVRLGALPCGHGFHEACIRRWLDTGALDCPVCRWPAHAPHFRQQRQLIGQLLSVVRATLHGTSDSHLSS